MLDEIASHLRRRESFAFETTLSGRRYVRMIPRWQRMGYRIKLIFLYLPDVTLAIERVRVRVKQGGHNIPENVIRRRYKAGWKNFQEIYKDLPGYFMTIQGKPLCCWRQEQENEESQNSCEGRRSCQGRRCFATGCETGQENSGEDAYSTYHLREWTRDPEKDKGENEEFKV